MDQIGLLASPRGCARPAWPPQQRAPPVHGRSRAKGGAMAEFVATVDISRRPDEVFAYAADPVHTPLGGQRGVRTPAGGCPSPWARKSW
jgi:hypothetical protein